MYIEVVSDVHIIITFYEYLCAVIYKYVNECYIFHNNVQLHTYTCVCVCVCNCMLHLYIPVSDDRGGGGLDVDLEELNISSAIQRKRRERLECVGDERVREEKRMIKFCIKKLFIHLNTHFSYVSFYSFM